MVAGGDGPPWSGQVNRRRHVIVESASKIDFVQRLCIARDWRFVGWRDPDTVGIGSVSEVENARKMSRKGEIFPRYSQAENLSVFLGRICLVYL